MTGKIKFGTDGWRGVIADDYTFENVRRAAQGFASYLIQNGKQGQTVIVGYDKRFDSEFFAASVAEVLTANGLNVHLTDGPTPTPVISFSVVNHKAVAAVNITASHNPPTDNGFKVRNEFGGAIDPDGLKQIESLIPDSIDDVKREDFEQAAKAGRITKFDAAPAYVDASQRPDRPRPHPPGRPHSDGRLDVGQRRRLVRQPFIRRHDARH